MLVRTHVNIPHFPSQAMAFYLILMPPLQARQSESVLTDGVDYTLANPDTLTKYKEAGQISQRALKAVAGC
jgi:hypothetical protein